MDELDVRRRIEDYEFQPFSDGVAFGDSEVGVSRDSCWRVPSPA